MTPSERGAPILGSMSHNSYALPGGAVAATGRTVNSRLSRLTVIANAGEAASFCKMATYSMRERLARRLAGREPDRQNPGNDRGGDRRRAPANEAPPERVDARIPRRLGRRAANARFDRGQKVARRLDGVRGFGERGKPRFPGSDRLIEVGLAHPPGRDDRALRRIEGAERIFGGGEIVVGADGHEAMQSLSWARLRWSHVLIVATGRPKRRASASRLEPR